MTPHLSKALEMELKAEYLSGYEDGRRAERKRICKELSEKYGTQKSKTSEMQGLTTEVQNTL